MKYITLLLFVAAFIQSKKVLCQNIHNPPREYRIIAISVDDNTESISNEIKLYLPLQLHFPTAFTPNGDGLNDNFGPVGEGIEGYKLTVFNRWGETVFSSKDINEKWDGSHNGLPVPFGIYNYEVLAYGREIGEVHRSGHVTVVN